MEKITIIYGPARSGKTRLAEDIAANKNTVWLCGRNYFKSRSNFKLQELTDKTELIVVDDIPPKFTLEAMAEFAAGEIFYHIKGVASFVTIPRPKVIFTLDVEEFKFPEGASIDARFDFIRLESIDDYFKEYERLFGHVHPEITIP